MDTSIDGGGLITLSGAGLTEVLMVNSAAHATVANLTISNGGSGVSGVSAMNNYGTLIIINSTFAKNSGYLGGAHFNDATLTVNNSHFDQNNAATGGAIYNNSSGTLTVTHCLFTNNSADTSSSG